MRTHGARVPAWSIDTTPDGLLTAMLQRIQTELRDVWRVRVPVNSKDSAHIGAVAYLYEKLKIRTIRNADPSLAQDDTWSLRMTGCAQR